MNTIDGDGEICKATIANRIWFQKALDRMGTPRPARASSMALHRGSTVIHPGDKTQPRLLLMMMSHVQQELEYLNCNDSPPSDMRRLQVFREVFDYFIREFKTYEPLLSEIKNVYESIISSQQATIDELTPLRSKISVSENEAAQEMLRVKRMMATEINSAMAETARVKAENDDLQSEIRLLRAQITALEEDVRKADNAKQGEELARRRLKEFQEESELLEAHLNTCLKEKEEETLELQNALKRSEQGVRDLHLEIERLNQALSATVPRAALDESVAKTATLAERLRLIESELESSNARVESLTHTMTTKDKVIKQSEGDKYPRWDYIAFNCPGPITEYGVMCKGMDYNDTIVVLLRQLLLAKASARMSTGDLSSKTDGGTAHQESRFFVGLGVGADVPKHLRFRGKIPNRKLSKKNCVLLINDLWCQKAVYDSSPRRKDGGGGGGSVRVSLAEFLFMFLKKRFGTQDAIAEWGYNLHSAAKQHSFQSIACQIFYEVLTGTLDEDVYLHQQATLERLKTSFHKYDNIKHDGRGRGIVTKAEAATILRDFWPWKSVEALGQLRSAIDADQSGELVTYQWLFQNESESLFLEIVREQMMDEREEYIRGFTSKLRSFTKDAKVSAFDITRALSGFDPEKSKRDVDAYLERGWGGGGGGMRIEQIKSRSLVELTRFVENLRRGVLEKTRTAVVS